MSYFAFFVMLAFTILYGVASLLLVAYFYRDWPKGIALGHVALFWCLRPTFWLAAITGVCGLITLMVRSVA